MNQKMLIIMLLAGTALFSGGIILLNIHKIYFLTHKIKTPNHPAPFFYSIPRSRTAIQEYLRKMLTPSLQSGFDSVKTNIQLTDNIAFVRWVPDALSTAAIQVEFAKNSNKINRIIFHTHTTQSNVLSSKLNATSSATLAQAYWINSIDVKLWTCGIDTNNTPYCTAYKTTGNGKETYWLYLYQGILAVSCLVPKNSELLVSNCTTI